MTRELGNYPFKLFSCIFLEVEGNMLASWLKVPETRVMTDTAVREKEEQPKAKTKYENKGQLGIRCLWLTTKRAM